MRSRLEMLYKWVKYILDIENILTFWTSPQIPFINAHMVQNIMTSSNGNIFRVTGHLCGEFTGPRWIPPTKARSFDVFFDMRLNERLSKQSWGWWFEMLSRPLWRRRNEFMDWVLFWVVAVWDRGRMVWCHSSAVADTKRIKVCLRKQVQSSLASMWG